jgi:hypothetical protein
MARKVRASIPAAPIVHSQLALPKRGVQLPPVPEERDGLWVCVNRICDQYMPQLFDASGWYITTGENAQR